MMKHTSICSFQIKSSWILGERTENNGLCELVFLNVHWWCASVLGLYRKLKIFKIIVVLCVCVRIYCVCAQVHVLLHASV